MSFACQEIPIKVKNKLLFFESPINVKEDLVGESLHCRVEKSV